MNRISKLFCLAFLIGLLVSPVYRLCAQTNKKDGDMDSKQQFLDAISKGEIAKVKELLEKEPSLNSTTDSNGVSAVLQATYRGRNDIADLLIKSGLSLDIFEASATGQLARVEELVKQDPGLVNQFARDGFYPLGLAVFFRHKDVVEFLITNGADVHAAARNSMKVTSLHAAAASQQTDIVKLLLAHGADANARQQAGYTALHESASQGNIEMARLLLQYGADINAKSDDGKTALTFAIDAKKSGMEEFLREHGAKQ